MTGTTIPRIYVADLAAYNAGRLHGIWIDATQDVEAMEEEVRAMLAASPIMKPTEYAIHDADGYHNARVDPWTNLQIAHDLACIIVEHGRLGAALANYCDNDVDEANRLFADGCYLGAWESTADYVQDLTEQTTEIPNHLAMYIDYQAMARDMELNGEIFTIEIDGETHIFVTI